MPNPLIFLIVLVILLIVAAGIWHGFGVNRLFSGMTQTQRLLVALLGLLIIIGLFFWFFTRYPLTGF